MKEPTEFGSKFLPWSISRLGDWERCPRYAHEVHVLRNRPEQGLAASRGEMIHKEAERYLTAKTTPRMPTSLPIINHIDVFKEQRSVKVRWAEGKFGLTSSWEPTEFFAKNVWCRGVYDFKGLVADGVWIDDYKTGKRYDSHIDQLKLYAIAALSEHPAAPMVRARAIYLDERTGSKPLTFVLTREHVDTARNGFEKRVNAMATAKRADPKPNARCKWCHINKANGGTCDAPNK